MANELFTALLLIAHGSRRAEANADLEYAAEQLRRRGPYTLIETCYLDVAEPNIETGAARCVQQGAKRILMLPYFLSPGMHVAEDLESMRQRLLAKHPGVDFRLCDPIGRHPLLVEILTDRARQTDQSLNQ